MQNVTELKNLPAGMYIYKVSDKNNCVAGGEITFEEPESGIAGSVTH